MHATTAAASAPPAHRPTNLVRSHGPLRLLAARQTGHLGGAVVAWLRSTAGACVQGACQGTSSQGWMRLRVPGRQQARWQPTTSQPLTTSR
jgi:hypothetical protein